MEDIIFLFFGDNIDIYYRKVIAAILFLPFTMLNDSLIILILFVNLALMDKKIIEITSY